MKFFKLRKIPFIIFLVLTIIPVTAFILLYSKSATNFNNMLNFLALPMIFFFNFIGTKNLFFLFDKLDIHLYQQLGIPIIYNVFYLPVPPTTAGIIVMSVIYVIFIFLIAKIINISFHKKDISKI